MKNKKTVIYLIILAISICFFIFSIARFTKRISKKDPRIKEKIEYVDSSLSFEDTTHDFGTLYAGDIVYKDFYITNEGQEKVKILKVKTSCGCTAVDHPKYLKPGKNGKIKIKYNTTSRSGKTRATIHVITNSKTKKETKIIISAQVNPSLLIDPPVTLFYNVDESGDQQKIISIKSDPNADYDFKIKKIKMTVDFADFEYKKIEKNHYEIQLSIDADKTKLYYKKRVDKIMAKNPKYNPPEHKKVGGTLEISFKSKDNRTDVYYFYASINK
jgi:hypothetical protein